MTTLKSIALELLQKYEESETSVIWEYSGDIEKSEKYLDAEVTKYRELIDKYAEQEPKTGHWIPVSERLPEIGDYVLCSVANYYSKYKIAISQYNRENFWHNGIIEAWMPLPEPYEPQEREVQE